MKILLVDDEPDVRNSLSNFLKKLGDTVQTGENGLQALDQIRAWQPDLVLTDIRMPGMDGMELVRRLKTVERSPVDIVIITGHGDMDSAVEALRCGAYDYITKPINVRELAHSLDRYADYNRLRSNYLNLKTHFHEKVDVETRLLRGEAEQLRQAYLKEVGLDDICIYSEAMREVMDLANRYSSDRLIPVLIEGESGTGKELIARYIHHAGSMGRPLPFVPINCGAVPQDLCEGELFGHEAGAYTGATARGRMGMLEAANSGTIFLDEIGVMPLNLQVKLLRVIEERKLFRVGGIKEIPLDIRIISATNNELQHQVDLQQFRLDLYYRLNVGAIRIPPLRDRKDDILPLARRFAGRSFRRTGKVFDRFSPATEHFLLDYEWPGNVRELKNAMERLAILAHLGTIETADLAFIAKGPAKPAPLRGGSADLKQDSVQLPDGPIDLEALNQEIILKALQRHQGNQTRTAQYLGLSRRVLQGRLNRLKAAGLLPEEDLPGSQQD